ncbi:MAG TPA: ATP-binding protein [Polyangiaceae bacterium]|jgi:signal transduction histidine kinase|nr:ATP-binding protein [Polyangiaceae bacterium]
MRKVPARGHGGERHAERGVRESQTVPARDQEISAPHARIPEAVPASWLDRFLVAVVELPLASGERAVVEAMVETLASILPGYAVAACFAPEPGAGRREQLVVKRLPEGCVETPGGMDPTRIFPWMAHEHVAPVKGSTAGSTLHVASEEDGLERESSPAVHLVDRAASALGRALGHSRQLGLVSGAQRDARLFEERMIQADKLATFGQIAAGVVHELNNPLTSIVAYSDYLIRKAVARGPSAAAPEEADDVERLRRISESANRMLRFTRDLVHYARPSGSVAGPVVLHGVIDQAVAFCEHVLAAASMRVERRYGADVMAVRGVGEQLVQVFVNLLTNASQAATAQGALVVVTTSLDVAERRVTIHVEDNGSGIKPEHASEVFAPFFTTKGDHHGTGLGLSIVKSIVESHEGDIRVVCEPGHGACFVVDLPAWQRG